jgi:hypothetical protein
MSKGERGELIVCNIIIDTLDSLMFLHPLRLQVVPECSLVTVQHFRTAS